MLKDALKRLLLSPAGEGLALIIAALLAMLLVNSPLDWLYNGFLDTEIQIRIDDLDLHKPILLWVNEGLMALFFLYIGLEVKKELLDGALSSKEQALLPIIAAVGGIAIPIMIYLAVNLFAPQTLRGWPIPAATDIAFALGILGLLGSRVPSVVKVFLLSLAIIQDLAIILIIALFYTADLSQLSLLIATIAIIGLLILNRCRVMRLTPYLLLGLVLWVAVLKSGVHTTLAGVLVGLVIPYHGNYRNTPYSPSRFLKRELHPWCAYLILPLIAFANTGVALAGVHLPDLLSAAPLGAGLGLLIGKPLGISLFSWLALKQGRVRLPEGLTFAHIVAISILCGAGFSMSMFLSSLAFEYSVEYIPISRLGILLGSTLATIGGYLALRFFTKP